MEILLHELQPSNVFGSFRVTEKRNPQGPPWGKRKAVFSVCRVKTVGSTEETFPLLTLGLARLRRRIDPSPVEERLEADLNALRDESHDHRVSRFGSLLGGTQESHTSAWSISSSGPKSRALSSALCEIRPPWRPCGRDIRHTLNQPGKLPFSSPPRRATVSRSPTWPACPPTESYLIRSEKTRDKDLKERRDLDHQAHFFPAPVRILVDP